MSDRIDLGSRPWKAIPHEVLRDARLTAKAKGGLVTLLSHEEGWVRSAIGVLQRECRIGRAQAQAIMRELRDLGYADMITERALDGSLATHYVVNAECSQPTGSEPGTIESPVAGKPGGRVSGRAGNRAAEVEAPDVEPLELLEPQGSKTYTSGRPEPTGFALWYETFPYRRARLAAEKAYRAACKITTPDVLLSAAERFRDDPNLPDDASKVPYPASWLRAGRWEDDPLPERNGHRPSQHPIDRRVAEIMARRNGQ